MKNLDFLLPIPINRKVRIGGEFDGGYILYSPSLNRCDVLMSYGIGWDTRFEEDFHRIRRKEVHMYDPTMIGAGSNSEKTSVDLLKKGEFKKWFRHIRQIRRWKKKFKDLRKKGIFFHNEGLADKPGKKYDTFKNHLFRNRIGEEKVLLKIDIEENEYPIFAQEEFYESLLRVDQIVIEFHNLGKRLEELRTIVERLKKEGFEIVHIHGNNYGGLFRVAGTKIDFPEVIELTLVKKESIRAEDIQDREESYPVEGLDQPNYSLREDFVLQFA